MQWHHVCSGCRHNYFLQPGQAEWAYALSISLRCLWLPSKKHLFCLLVSDEDKKNFYNVDTKLDVEHCLRSWLRITLKINCHQLNILNCYWLRHTVTKSVATKSQITVFLTITKKFVNPYIQDSDIGISVIRYSASRGSVSMSYERCLSRINNYKFEFKDGRAHSIAVWGSISPRPWGRSM